MITKELKRVVKAASLSFEPPAKLKLSDWADAKRVLSKENSALPGAWRTSITPHLREPMNAITNPDIERVVLMFSSQMGKTEIMLNAIGYFTDIEPSPMLYVLPTLTLAEDFSKERIAPMIRDTPVLANLIGDPKTRSSQNTVLYKKFPGGYLSLAGSNSPSSLSYRPIRILLMDELDRYKASAGTEGDPVALAYKRTATFYNRKIILSSSPTIKDASRIERAYLESNQQVYKPSCPECNHYQELKWENLHWQKGKAKTHLPETAFYSCEMCGCVIEAKDKFSFLEKAKWVKTGKSKNAGFRISELYSRFRSWEEIIEDFLEAKKDPFQLRVFMNTTLNELWEERGEAPQWELLFSRREDYKRNIIPKGGLLLIAGVDVQDDRVEIEIVAYGRNKESWSIDYRVYIGEPKKKKVWEDLAAIFEERFETHEGKLISLRLMAVDSGYATTEVYNFGRWQGADRVMVVKGRDEMNSILTRPNAVDVTKDGRKITKGVLLWSVGVSIVKKELYSYLRLERIDEPQAGYCHFPDYDEEFFKQLTAEDLVRRKHRRGFYRFEFVKNRTRNEALDCRVYARAAAAQLGIDRFTDMTWQALEKQSAQIQGRRKRKARQISKGLDL